MPFTKPVRSTKRWNARTCCLLLTVTLIWLTGCSLIGPKKTAARNTDANGNKFSCGEDCPQGSKL